MGAKENLQTYIQLMKEKKGEKLKKNYKIYYMNDN